MLKEDNNLFWQLQELCHEAGVNVSFETPGWLGKCDPGLRIILPCKISEFIRKGSKATGLKNTWKPLKKRHFNKTIAKILG